MGSLNSTVSDAQKADDDAQMSLGYFKAIRAGYDDLVNAIIRPPRAIYAVDALGPATFRFCNKSFQRNDLSLVNQHGLTLQCSHWKPAEGRVGRLPCVVFIHGNSSARFEVVTLLPTLLSIGTTVFAFDCAGSGKSEGKYVSLGFFERGDLRVVIDHLRGSGTVSTLAVWGRSMGAVTGAYASPCIAPTSSFRMFLPS
jgi:pimeloyl-ACP methyl ester carboxylesterase